MGNVATSLVIVGGIVTAAGLVVFLVDPGKTSTQEVAVGVDRITYSWRF
jgi:hypothetical protein